MAAHELIMNTHQNGHPSTLPAILISAAEDLEIRFQVLSLVNSIVEDIELAHQLQIQLDHHHTLRTLEEKTILAQKSLEDYKATYDNSSQRRLELADSFAQQLWKLDSVLGDIEKIKSDYEEKVQVYDNIVKLWECRSLTVDENEQIVQIFKSTILNQGLEGRNESVSVDAQPGQLLNVDGREKVFPIANDIIDEDGGNESHSVTGTFTGGILTQQLVCTNNNPVFDGMNQNINETNNGIVFDRKDQSINDSSGRNLLEQLPDKVLMCVFNFMTALEILNFAQTSLSNYSKVDRLFGLGGDQPQMDLTSSDQGASNTIEQLSTTEDFKASDDLKSVALRQPEYLTPAPETDHTGKSDKMDNILDVSGHSLRSPDIAYGNTIPNWKPQEPKGARIGGPLSQVLTLLPIVDKNSLGGLIKSKMSGRKAENELSDPLSSVKSTIVSKLSPMEMSAIISLRDERQKCISEIHHLSAENNSLRMKIDEFEPMKAFLMEKIGTLENSLEQRNEELRLLKDEVKSDQEVIAFLDLRVHELEKKCQSLEYERTHAIETADAVKNATQRQLTVMEDMLKFERENLVENEKEWKATKKLLVKEIKSIRAQLLTLRAERDAYSEQMTKYREALLAGSKIV